MWRIPVIGIEESNGLNPKTDGVICTDQARRGADVTMARGQHHMVGIPKPQSTTGPTIRYQHMQAGQGLSQYTTVTLTK